VSNEIVKKQKTLEGLIKNITDSKTASVKVNKLVRHKLYKKVIKKSKTYLVHTDGYDVMIGDKVLIVETRPISKLKSWRVYKIINKKL
jgi:small subunit ribosomal protein S17